MAVAGVWKYHAECGGALKEIRALTDGAEMMKSRKRNEVLIKERESCAARVGTVQAEDD